MFSSPRFANVTAVLALVVALGGTSYAAVVLPKDSVTTKQVKNGSLKAKDFKTGQLPAGATGPAGRSALTPLKTGESVSGLYGVGMKAAAAGDSYLSVASFPIPLAAALDGAHVIYVSGVSAPNCPGVGQAAAGFLCVYRGATTTNSTIAAVPIGDPTTNNPGTSTVGFALNATATAAGKSITTGTFTVTAP